MKTVPGRLVIIITALAGVSLGAVRAGPPRHSLNEDAALNLLLRTLEHDHVYANRISLNCVTFDTEEKTDAYFQFALRENHTEKCGGDPDISPIVDRYRVNRASKKIELYDAVKDSWQVYRSSVH